MTFKEEINYLIFVTPKVFNYVKSNLSNSAFGFISFYFVQQKTSLFHSRNTIFIFQNLVPTTSHQIIMFQFYKF